MQEKRTVGDMTSPLTRRMLRHQSVAVSLRANGMPGAISNAPAFPGGYLLAQRAPGAPPQGATAPAPVEAAADTPRNPGRPAEFAATASVPEEAPASTPELVQEWAPPAHTGAQAPPAPPAPPLSQVSPARTASGIRHAVAGAVRPILQRLLRVPPAEAEVTPALLSTMVEPAPLRGPTPPPPVAEDTSLAPIPAAAGSLNVVLAAAAPATAGSVTAGSVTATPPIATPPRTQLSLPPAPPGSGITPPATLTAAPIARATSSHTASAGLEPAAAPPGARVPATRVATDTSAPPVQRAVDAGVLATTVPASMLPAVNSEAYTARHTEGQTAGGVISAVPVVPAVPAVVDTPSTVFLSAATAAATLFPTPASAAVPLSTVRAEPTPAGHAASSSSEDGLDWGRLTAILRAHERREQEVGAVPGGRTTGASEAPLTATPVQASRLPSIPQESHSQASAMATQPAGAPLPAADEPRTQAASEDVVQLLQAVQPARATASAVHVIAPRSPRPVQRKLSSPRTAPQGSEEAGETAAALTPMPLVPTEIGALPADFWTLLGETPPIVRPLELGQTTALTASSGRAPDHPMAWGSIIPAPGAAQSTPQITMLSTAVNSGADAGPAVPGSYIASHTASGQEIQREVLRDDQSAPLPRQPVTVAEAVSGLARSPAVPPLAPSPVALAAAPAAAVQRQEGPPLDVAAAPAASPALAGRSGVPGAEQDVHALAELVYAELRRRLAVERERLGL
jgi:hypothetical protein